MNASEARCRDCGGPLQEDLQCKRCADRTVARIIRRDISFLTALAVCAVLLFLCTRSIAKWDNGVTRSRAEQWFASGTKAAAAGDLQGATKAFRRAAVDQPHEFRYSLALAKSLEAGDQNEEARQILLELRESSPEDPQVNLEIARIAAKRQDLTEASRYYRHALFGNWPDADSSQARIRIRLELLRFELLQNQREAAMSDALLLDSEIPQADVSSRLALANVYLDMQEWDRALRVFNQVLAAHRDNVQALLGAAKANLNRGQFFAANTAMETAWSHGEHTEEAARLRDLIRIVLQNDPSLRRLPTSDRFSRSIAALDTSLLRLQSCGSTYAAGSPEREEISGAISRIVALKGQLSENDFSHDSLVDTLSLVYDSETLANRRCAASGQTDNALLIISRKAREFDR
jgi:tetratricopeptide (TPR) repeat protein